MTTQRTFTPQQKALNERIRSADQLTAVIAAAGLSDTPLADNLVCRPDLAGAFNASLLPQLYISKSSSSIANYSGHWTAAGASGNRYMTFTDTDGARRRVAWWLEREMFREQYGLYPTPSPVLCQLRGRGFFQNFPHMAVDSDAVAFTADIDGAHNDKQVRTSIGRLLRRFCMLFSDADIQKLEQEHVSWADPSFQVASTIDEVYRVYTTMAGDTGCMRHKSLGGLKDYHPSAIYARPQDGVRVAYLEQDGVVTARSVIYDNPDDPNDKRYVRLYGSPQLGAKLTRAGYRLAGLKGAKLNLLRDSAFYRTDEEFIAALRDGGAKVPCSYMDLPGGPSIDGRDCKALYGYVPQGVTDHFVVIDEAQSRTMAADGFERCGLSSTSGVVTLREYIPPRTFVCPRTGQSVTDRQAVRYLRDDNQVDLCHPSAPFDAAAYMGATLVRVSAEQHARLKINVRWANPFSPPSDVLALPSLDAQLQTFELIKLADQYSPDAPTYIAKNNPPAEFNAFETIAGEAWKSDDTCWLFTADGVRPVAMPLSSVTPEFRKAHVPTLKHNGRQAWAPRDLPTLIKLASGRRAVRGVHAVVQLLSGEWAQASAVDTVRLGHAEQGNVPLTSSQLTQVYAHTEGSGAGAVAAARAVAQFRIDSGFEAYVMKGRHLASECESSEAWRKALVYTGASSSLGGYGPVSELDVLADSATAFSRSMFGTADTDVAFLGHVQWAVAAVERAASAAEAAPEIVIGPRQLGLVVWAGVVKHRLAMYEAALQAQAATIQAVNAAVEQAEALLA